MLIWPQTTILFRLLLLLLLDSHRYRLGSHLYQSANHLCRLSRCPWWRLGRCIHLRIRLPPPLRDPLYSTLPTCRLIVFLLFLPVVPTLRSYGKDVRPPTPQQQERRLPEERLQQELQRLREERLQQERQRRPPLALRRLLLSKAAARSLQLSLSRSVTTSPNVPTTASGSVKDSTVDSSSSSSVTTPKIPAPASYSSVMTSKIPTPASHSSATTPRNGPSLNGSAPSPQLMTGRRDAESSSTRREVGRDGAEGWRERVVEGMEEALEEMLDGGEAATGNTKVMVRGRFC